MSKVRGVNLGEWLVLEKWMDPSIFRGTNSMDEDNLCSVLSEEEKRKRYKIHRDNYITEKDIAYIASLGLDSIRLPIPHFVFDDDPKFCSPYVGCIEYVDKLFKWAEKYNLSVLLDIHTAPDCQNGYDNGGICGVSKWHSKKENIQRMIDVLSLLAERYGKRESLYGIELLNEPANEDVWERNTRHYGTHDEKRAEGSGAVPSTVLFDFYTESYEKLRKIMGEDKAIVFHDAFRFSLMKNFFKESGFKNAILDTHLYLEMEGIQDYTSTTDHLIKIFRDWDRSIVEMQKVVPVMVGEWSIPHNIDPSLSPEQRFLSYRLMSDAMLMTFEKAYAYYYWSYRVECYDKEGWDFRRCIDKGWLPSKFGEKSLNDGN